MWELICNDVLVREGEGRSPETIKLEKHTEGEQIRGQKFSHNHETMVSDFLCK